MSKAKTRKERLAEYFTAGGEPLEYQQIAELLGATESAASSVMSELEHASDSTGMWQADVRRVPRRTLFDLERVPTKVELTRERVRQALLADGGINNHRLSKNMRCSERLVSNVRAELVASGWQQPPIRTNRSQGREIESATVTPTLRHPEDEPYLRRALRFREVWPVRVLA
ncbi:hypothetical protein HNR62_001055 [Oceanisphaera litoralis]|uniref:hypothetical protein n=1 Tax=Oceanisphaera litoralis TaxID=225144 RepID=UPI00195734C5|nr:hypothetical protein [Oceanisphaera litoralis]MBM7455195.1 hypothetical protein [Oceanisphaera litoralis]